MLVVVVAAVVDARFFNEQVRDGVGGRLLEPPAGQDADRVRAPAGFRLSISIPETVALSARTPTRSCAPRARSGSGRSAGGCS